MGRGAYGGIGSYVAFPVHLSSFLVAFLRFLAQRFSFFVRRPHGFCVIYSWGGLLHSMHGCRSYHYTYHEMHRK